MIYVAGLALAFIFGVLIGRERERLARRNTKPLDLGLTNQDLLLPTPKEEPKKADDINWGDVAMYYKDKGGRWFN